MSNIPQLRFREFIDDWEHKILGNIANITMGQSPDSSSYNDDNLGLPLIQGNADCKNRKTYPRIHTSQITKECFVDDIIMTVRAPVGAVSKSYHHACIGRGVCAIKAKENNDFLFQFLIKHEELWRKYSQGSTFTAVNSSDIKNLKIFIPTKPEQEKISFFLTSLDIRVDQLIKKDKLLQKYKKGITQQLFSQEIRFKKDDGREFSNWEEKKLGEITYKVSQKNKENIPYPIYSINNRDGFIPQSEQFEGVDSHSRNYDISLYKIVNENTFAYNPARINVGSLGYSGNLKEIIISSLYVCFKTIDSISDDFLLQYFKTYDFNKNVLRNTEGGVREYLFYEKFSNIRTKIPSFEEQIKISNFLSSIDKKIEKNQNILEQTKEFKKGLLQQMFV